MNFISKDYFLENFMSFRNYHYYKKRLTCLKWCYEIFGKN